MKRKYWFDYLFSVGGLFILVIIVGKFYYLWDLKMPLSYDESYYWDWSRRLDWGYYSKPPMVAWLIYLSTTLFGNTELAVRFPALLCQSGSLILLYVLVFRYFGEIAARSLLFTLAFVPIFMLYNFIMTIDPPLIFFWSLTFYGLVEFLKAPSLFWSLFTGFALGASLLTKQTSFMFLFLSFAYFLLFERTYFSQKKTYLIFILALLLYLPNLYWNFTQGFLLIKHTEEHFQRFFPGFEYYLRFWIGIALLFGPLFIPLFFYIGFFFLRRLRTIFSTLYREAKYEVNSNKFSLRIMFLSYFFSFPPLLFFLILSLFIEFNHNWIMPFFLFSYIWVVLMSFQRKIWRAFISLNIFFSFFLSLLLLSLPTKPDLFGKNSVLLFKKFYGWPELAKRVERYVHRDIPIVVRSRELASSLAFYLSFHPQVYVVNPEGVPQNQYHLWRNTKDLIGKEVIYVEKDWSVPPFLKRPIELDKVNLNFYGVEKNFSIWKGIFKGDK